MLRASNSVNLTLFFGRAQITLKDFNWIYGIYQKNSNRFTGENGASFLFYYAKALELNKMKNKAKKIYHLCKKNYPKSIFAQKIK